MPAGVEEHCSRCGAAASPGASFCGECGAPLPGAEAPRNFGDTARKGAFAEPPAAPGLDDPTEPAEPPAPSGAVPADNARGAETRVESEAERAAAPAGTVPGQPLADAMGHGIGHGAGHAKAELAPMARPLPSAAALARARLEPGSLVDNKYAILRVLGEGGMGVVYLARDVHTGVEVVLKALRAELAHRPDVRARALAEGRILAQIDHPNVVRLNAVVVEGSSLWLVMQYIEGESLDGRIARLAAEKRPMPLPEALGIFRQVVAGVAAAHREGVIHRDIKPANVLIRQKDGVAKVGDFGIAKAEEDARAARGATRGIIGSIQYMSPEQVLGRRDVDKRVDVYGLGIVLYEMLVGAVPFDAESDREIMRLQVEAPVPRVSASRPDVPPEIDAVVARCCAKDREARFASCEELLAALDALEAPRPAPLPSLPPRGAPAQTLPDEPRPGGGRCLPVALGALVLASGLSAGLLYALRLPPFDAPRPAASARASALPETPGAPDAGAEPDEPEKDGLESLAGVWVSESGNVLEAVPVGDALEFRVGEPGTFERAGYRLGETRFVLRRRGDGAGFSVEDRVRPDPPIGFRYDPARSRATCQEIFTEVGGRPLSATLDADGRLTVSFAKISPTPSHFVIEGRTVTNCNGLSKLDPSRIVSTLRRRS